MVRRDSHGIYSTSASAAWESHHEIGSQISRRALATPLSGSTWPFFKFTDEIENGRVYLTFSV